MVDLQIRTKNNHPNGTEHTQKTHSSAIELQCFLLAVKKKDSKPNLLKMEMHKPRRRLRNGSDTWNGTRR